MKMTADEYREMLGEDSDSWAIVPKTVAMKWLGITSLTFDKWVKAGRIQQLRIREAKRERCILAKSVFDILTEREERKEKTWNMLAERARKGGTITYSDLMRHVGMTANFPNDRKVMGSMLGEISRETAREHGFMLSALAVLKNTGIPSDSFFEQVEDLGMEHPASHMATFDKDDWEIWLKEHMPIIYDRAECLKAN